MLLSQAVDKELMTRPSKLSIPMAFHESAILPAAVDISSLLSEGDTAHDV
jgi:hypothetical protein